MTPHFDAFDRWIRTSFKEMNTALEELYFVQDDRDSVAGVGDAIKDALTEEGRSSSAIFWPRAILTKALKMALTCWAMSAFTWARAGATKLPSRPARLNHRWQRPLHYPCNWAQLWV